MLFALLVAVSAAAQSEPDAAGIETPTAPPAAPSDPPTEIPTATVPATIAPTATGTAAPTETATVAPTIPPTGTLAPTPTIAPTVAPTIPPTTVATTPPTALPPRVTMVPALPDTAAPGPEPAPVALTDRFDDTTSRLLGETREGQRLTTGRYDDGEYLLSIDAPEAAPDLIAAIRSPVLADATIDVSVRFDGVTAGRYVMATCREVEGYGGYRAYLSPEDGYFAITRFEPGAVPSTLQWGFADELILGDQPFDFSFSCTGYVLELRVDDQTIGIAADNSFAAGTVSIGIGYFVNAESGPVTARFDSLTVSGTVTATGAVDAGTEPRVAPANG